MVRAHLEKAAIILTRLANKDRFHRGLHVAQADVFATRGRSKPPPEAGVIATRCRRLRAVGEGEPPLTVRQYLALTEAINHYIDLAF
jgi:hypothetical protein